MSRRGTRGKKYKKKKKRREKNPLSVVVKLYLSFFPRIACFFSLSLSLFFFSLPPFSQLFFFFLFVLHSFYKYPCTSFTSPCRSKAKSKKSKNVCRFFCCIFHIAFFCVFQDVNKFFFARRVKTLFAIFSCLSISFGFFSLFSPSFVTIRCVFLLRFFFVFVFFSTQVRFSLFGTSKLLFWMEIDCLQGQRRLGHGDARTGGQIFLGNLKVQVRPLLARAWDTAKQFKLSWFCSIF